MSNVLKIESVVDAFLKHMQELGERVGMGVVEGLKAPPECGVHTLLDSWNDEAIGFVQCSHLGSRHVALYATDEDRFVVMFDRGSATRYDNWELAERAFHAAADSLVLVDAPGMRV